MATSMGAAPCTLVKLQAALSLANVQILVLMDISPLHNQPRFRGNSENVYAQIIYASKSTDITDVMVNGKWLMREQELLTIDEKALIAQAQQIASRN